MTITDLQRAARAYVVAIDRTKSQLGVDRKHLSDDEARALFYSMMDQESAALRDLLEVAATIRTSKRD